MTGHSRRTGRYLLVCICLLCRNSFPTFCSFSPRVSNLEIRFITCEYPFEPQTPAGFQRIPRLCSYHLQEYYCPTFCDTQDALTRLSAIDRLENWK
ncbi:hypothetical protein A0H81_08024 [Grifola frondosa]|uniref:Secreted protein n=1 Tax=Grifola frondosa TaxID=5627 RepID=A0A1C7M741_GRIFR|nr:hypothetical protein A0H81_08024 [Grifola frondosa]